MTWRDKNGEPIFRRTPDDVWPLEFEDRPRPEPKPTNAGNRATLDTLENRHSIQSSGAEHESEGAIAQTIVPFRKPKRSS